MTPIKKISEFDNYIKHNAELRDIDEALIRAVIMAESSWEKWAFKVEKGFWKLYMARIQALFYSTKEKDERWLNYPDIVSSSYGLMQVMLSTAMDMGFRFTVSPFELFEPKINIYYGCKYLRKQYNRYNTWYDAISAYNQGNNRKVGYSFKNQKHVDKVTAYWNMYERKQSLTQFLSMG